MSHQFISSGTDKLDSVIQGFQPGDNVVWQVDSLDSYRFFAEPFISRSIEAGRTCLYIRFADHEPILAERSELHVVEVDPKPGFEAFSGDVHRIINDHGRKTFYVFDNLTSLVSLWATDELLANFFQATCPFLYELDTVAFFALGRGSHAYRSVARIRETTQVLIDVHYSHEQMIVHPLKVRNLNDPVALSPYIAEPDRWTPLMVEDSARDTGEAIGAAAPWVNVYQGLKKILEEGDPEAELSPRTQELRTALSNMLFGSDPELNRLADGYLSIKQICDIRDRMIGSGRVGGKAAGMILARAVLSRKWGGRTMMEGPENSDSWFIGSDVFYTYLIRNALFRLRLQLTQKKNVSQEDFEEAESRFLAGQFPKDVFDSFRSILETIGENPIIVRSSSLLEDGFGNAFAGKYLSVFCVNQGSIDDRLKALATAVKQVYASTLNPDALTYRHRRGLAETDEQMGILIQRVAGGARGRHHYPLLAGVAFSRNLHVWTDRIDPMKGVIRLVFGLGTRAVNRIERDYPRMIAISHPELRPEIGEEIIRYSQRDVDLLDLNTNAFEIRNFKDVIKGEYLPGIHQLISFQDGGNVTDPIVNLPRIKGGQPILTFNNLIRNTGFVRIMGELLEALEKAYGHPVDTEFAAELSGSGDPVINLLQCRPLTLPGGIDRIKWPEGIPKNRILFRSNRFISGGRIPDIRFIVYIDPRKYSALRDLELKKSLPRMIARLNRHFELHNETVIMMGPGRWGSTNLDLGIPIGYADIDHVSVLVEISREEAGHVPEVSYGTHFFQDLVEANTIYLPVYPDDEESGFNERFFRNAPNALHRFIDDSRRYGDTLRLIDVPEVTDGATACLLADPEQRRAMCYLQE